MGEIDREKPSPYEAEDEPRMQTWQWRAIIAAVCVLFVSVGAGGLVEWIAALVITALLAGGTAYALLWWAGVIPKR